MGQMVTMVVTISEPKEEILIVSLQGTIWAGVRNQRKDMLCQILRNQDQDWKCMKGINLEDKALEAYT